MGDGSPVAEQAETGESKVYAGYSRPFAEDELGLVRRFLIADAYARFRRARGDSVLLRLGVESFGEAAEREASRRGTPPRLLVDEYVGQLRQRFQSLAISCDWDGTVISSDPKHCLRTQSMFLGLLERDVVYRRDQAGRPGWAIRTSRFAARCDLGSSPPVGWTAEAVATQKAALGRVDGVEIDAILPGAGTLVVFTPHEDSIARAAFVAVSPNHREIDALAGPGELARLRNADEKAIAQTSLRVAVPGVSELLPLVVAPSIDARFGPTAVLGIPDQDEADRQVAGRLKPSAAMALGTMRIRSKPIPATRYRLPDLQITREAPWGAPVPVVNCQRCGVVPVPIAELPIQPPEPVETSESGDASPSTESAERNCPRCGASARRERASIDWGFDSMWMWPSICAKRSDGSAGLEEWATAGQVVWSRDDGDQLLLQRVAAYILNGMLSPSEFRADDEPFATALVHGSLDGDDADAAIEDVRALDEYVSSAGADAARFAILNVGSPGHSTHVYEHLLKHAERFIGGIREQVETLSDRDRPIPEEIDRSTRSRRRLAAGSRIAVDKLTTHLERLEMHKATYSLMLFQRRIRAFEDDCLENGGLAEADRDAIALALVQFGRMAEPLLPGLAADVEAIAGSAKS